MAGKKDYNKEIADAVATAHHYGDALWLMSALADILKEAEREGQLSAALSAIKRYGE